MKGTKLSRKHLPAALAELSPRRTFGLNVVSEGEAISAHDTRWGDGTRNVYHLFTPATGVLTRLDWVGEGDRLTPGLLGKVVVVTGHFCGQDTGVGVYIRDTDVAEFFGAVAPEGMPGAVAADWLTERADESKGAAAKRLRQVAELCREACV